VTKVSSDVMSIFLLYILFPDKICLGDGQLIDVVHAVPDLEFQYSLDRYSDLQVKLIVLIIMSAIENNPEESPAPTNIKFLVQNTAAPLFHLLKLQALDEHSIWID
jgi:hypothetical protein